MPIPNEHLDEVFLTVANGDPVAADVLARIARIVRLADNIADGDSDDVQTNMAEILCLAFVDLPRNPFYQTHAHTLTGPWLNAVLGWQAGDEWRHSENRKTRMFGFVYRETVEHIAHTVAYLTGGHEHALFAMRYLHEVSHASSPETIEDWEQE